MSVQNAWLLQRKNGLANVTQIQFRRNIAQHYCNSVALHIKNTQMITKFNIPATDRFDGFDHYPVYGTKRRYANSTCTRQCRIKCEKCDVASCVDTNCFKTFHNLVEN